jgi:uncharacterized protein (TIGR00730 family)
MEKITPHIRAITVYAASSSQVAPVYFEAAAGLGKLLATNDITCINGAGNRGLMATLTDTVLENGGDVVGIIPRFMIDEDWCHPALTERIVTSGMHDRKRLLMEQSDACIALPGGIGTFDELTEVITWKQLGLYSGSIVILNTHDYYAHFLALLAQAQEEHFMHSKHASMWSVARTPEEALQMIFDNQEWEKDPRSFAAL